MTEMRLEDTLQAIHDERLDLPDNGSRLNLQFIRPVLINRPESPILINRINRLQNSVNDSLQPVPARDKLLLPSLPTLEQHRIFQRPTSSSGFRTSVIGFDAALTASSIMDGSGSYPSGQARISSNQGTLFLQSTATRSPGASPSAANWLARRLAR